MTLGADLVTYRNRLPSILVYVLYIPNDMRKTTKRKAVDQFSSRADMLRVLMYGARGEQFARYPQGVFGRGIFGAGRELVTVYA